MNMRQRAGPFPHDWLAHPFLSFPSTLPDRESYISRSSELLTKQINIQQSPDRRIAGELGFPTLLESFLTRSLRDETGLVTLVSHSWCHILGFKEVIFRELVIKLLSIARFNRVTWIWLDDSALSSTLSVVSRSCSLLEVGQCLVIYYAKDIDHPL